MIQEITCPDSFVSISNSTVPLRRLFQQHRPTTDLGRRSGRRTGWTSSDGRLGRFDRSTALTIVNCPSKGPTAAIFGVPHFGARVARKPQSAESATGQLAYAALRSRTGRVVAAVRRSTEADASTRTRLTPLLRQFLPEWPDGNTCAGIRSTYSCWIGGSHLQGIVEPNG